MQVVSAVEEMLFRQIVAAVGKEVDMKAFTEYVIIHI
jgi:hypothetical protein